MMFRLTVILMFHSNGIYLELQIEYVTDNDCTIFQHISVCFPTPLITCKLKYLISCNMIKLYCHGWKSCLHHLQYCHKNFEFYLKLAIFVKGSNIFSDSSKKRQSPLLSYSFVVDSNMASMQNCIYCYI
jgi:hypothetical protein